MREFYHQTLKSLTSTVILPFMYDGSIPIIFADALMKRHIRFTLIFTLLLALFNPLYAQDKKSIDVLYLQIQQPERPTLSNLDPIPEDLGLKGA